MISEMSSAKSLAELGEVQTASNAAFASSYLAGMGREPKVAGVLSSLTKDGITVVAGNAGVFALQLESAGELDGEFDFNSELNQYVARNPYGYLLYENLRSNAEIKDRRVRFF